MKQSESAWAASPENVGVPEQPAIDAEYVESGAELFQEPTASADEDFIVDPEDLVAAPRLGSILSRPGVTALLALALAAVFMVVLTQAMSLLNVLRTLPDTVSIPAFAAGGLLLLIMLLAAVRLAVLYFKLRASPVVHVQAILDLAKRAEMRETASLQMSEACKVLRAFVRSYPLEGKGIEKLRRFGFKDEEIDRLRCSAASLSSREMSTYEGWLHECDCVFLGVLDGVARRRIRRYTAAVGIKTAAVPSGFADTTIVLLNAYLMVGDLCRIYNLRANRLGTLAIMAHVFVNAFSAAHLEELTDAAAEGLSGTISTAGGLMAGVARMVAARAAEGAGNGMLFYRLGSMAIRQLRPIRLPQSAFRMPGRRKPTEAH